MTLGYPYQISVTATYFTDPIMTVTKIVHIDTSSPSIQVAYIDGCNRLFSTNEAFNLTVMFNTN